MCLITGFINFENSVEKTLKVLKKLEHRGQDGKGIYTNEKVYFETSQTKEVSEVYESKDSYDAKNSHSKLLSSLGISSKKNSLKTLKILQKNLSDKCPTFVGQENSTSQFTKLHSPFSNSKCSTTNHQPPTTNLISLGHSLHSIIDFIPQPLEKNKNILISNCEIYNWKELKKEFNLNSKNDSELILDLIELKGYKQIKKIINLFEGPFAFAYYNKVDKTSQTQRVSDGLEIVSKKNFSKIILARDILGEKPLYYFYEKDKNQFAFCSEKKGISNLGKVKELNPREILVYNLKNNKLNFIENKLSYTGNFFTKDYKILKKETLNLLEKSILKMVPQNQKLGLLFSGGIDSTFIAYVLKKNNIDFTCYTAKLIGGNIKEASDYIYAKEIAKKYDFKLKIAEIHVDDLEKEVKEVIKLIEEPEYIKVSVALPFLLSCKLAKKDRVKVMLSGLGSEELFAGYRRHKQVEDANLECYKGLLTLHSRDLYRDDVICMSQNQEIRLPFLDKKLIKYALQIPIKYKLNLEENRSKIILRDIARDLGLDEKYCERAKKAAQYGSKFDKGLLRLAKNKGVGKQEYLDKLFK